jgi:hypothetical protein
MDPLKALKVFARVVADGGFAKAARARVFLDFLPSIFGGADTAPWPAAAGCAKQAIRR